MDLRNLIESLERGICPAELNYTNQKEDVIDWDKVRYNTFYKSNEFYENKFHPVLKNLPAFDKIIESIVEKNQDNSPLKEMELKQNKN